MIDADAVQINEWSKLDYLHPVEAIHELRLLRLFTPLKQAGAADSVTQRRMVKAAQWRAKPLQKYMERSQAAIFCHLLSQKMPAFEWRFAHIEKSDYDYVIRCHVTGEGKPWYKPVQLKELVPNDVNPSATLQDEINKLTKYVKAPNLVLAIYISKATTISFKWLTLPKLDIGQLWLFGVSKSGELFLCGDLLRNPQTDYFQNTVQLRHDWK